MESFRSQPTLKSPISSSVLKWIAITTMTIDHLAAFVLHPWLLASPLIPGTEIFVHWEMVYMIFRLIGRLAFPIFSFLIVVGFTHTRSVPKYAQRLGLFAFISEIPFDLAMSQSISNFSYQNVFFTLLLGLLAIWVYDTQTSSLYRIGLPILAALTAEFLNTDYGAYGVLMIFVLYLLRFNRPLQCIVGAVINLLQVTASLAFIPIYFYNGKKGRGNSKWLYLFYPIHLLFFSIIAYFLINLL